MSQRNSGYERKERDFYETPEWVTEALMPHLPARLRIWEPAAGSGRMVRALRTGGHVVEASDIAQGCDFLLVTEAMGCDAVVTNPPYVAAEAFIERALDLTRQTGIVAMLLRTDFDHARTRQHLSPAARPSQRRSF